MAHMSSHITFSQAGSSISNSLRTSFLPPSSPASKKNSDRATPKWTHLQPPRRRSPAPPVRAYADGPKQGAVMKFFRNLQGSLPLVGIVSRLVSAEGGVGSDRLRFAEFCRRVDKTLSPAAAEAFFKFQERHGKVARKQVVLLWCWAAAVGAGLVASDSILLGARRLRVSFDTEYEMDCLDSTMEESLKVRLRHSGMRGGLRILRQTHTALPFGTLSFRALSAWSSLDSALPMCVLERPTQLLGSSGPR
eukprot:TRINITY_DN4030_c0_g2_i1.p1 TRINITY_DN4030_c0_g2~~TRINITY_DN4030_c0_g2_i1.p1  ORF type:complete len:249 (+),score=28.11 TRINITY_DN4030_c0_g2_i1:211-957(+)